MANKITAIIDIVTGDARKSLKNLKQDIENTDGVIGKFKVGAKGGFEAIKQNIGAFSLASAGALLAFGDDIVNAGVSMEAMDAKAKTVFGTDGIALMREWAAESAGSLGLTERKAIDAGASIQDLLVPMGFARDDARLMTVDLLEVSGALSAWSGGTRSVDEVSRILTKSLLGEREELKSLGIAISEADVQTRLAEKGQKGLTGAALAQAKAIATQELIFEKSGDAQKAWTDGSMDATKQANEGKASFAQLGETLNATLYPVLIKLAPAVAELAETAGSAIEPLVGLIDQIDKIDGKGALVGLTGADEELFAIEDMQTEIEALGLDYKSMWMEVKAGDLTLAEVNTRMDEAREAQLDLTASLDGGEKSWEKTTAEVKAANKQFPIGVGHLEDLERAADHSGSQVEELADSVARLRGELDQEQAALDFEQAIDEFGQAMMDAKGDTDAQAQALITVKGKMLDYLATLQGVPVSKQTEIVALIDAGKLQEAEKLLNDLARVRTATVLAGVGQFSGSSGSGGGSAPRTGGPRAEFGPDGVSSNGGGNTYILNAYGVSDPVALRDMLNKELRRNGEPTI